MNALLIALAGTTTRIEAPIAPPHGAVELRIFTTEAECHGAVDPADVVACLPHVDRPRGEVRLAFQLRTEGESLPVALAMENVVLSHQSTRIVDGIEGQRATLVPHGEQWFEVRYQVDPFYLRRSFRTGIRVTGIADAEASVVFHPSAWLDGPSSGSAATLVLPTLGLLLGMSSLGAAWFNLKRALTGRVRD